MTTGSNIPTWKILCSEKPGELESLVSQRVGQVNESARVWTRGHIYTHRCVSCFDSSSNRNLHVCVHAQSCPTLCYSTDCSLPGSCVHGISQARILEHVAISSTGDFPDSGMEPILYL